MGQGYHSKLIFGAVLTEEQSEILDKFSDRQSNALYRFLEKNYLSQSYDVKPIWFGFTLASTDWLVAKMNDIVDIGNGADVSYLLSFETPAQKERFDLLRKYLKKYFDLAEGRLMLVKDYH